MKRFLFAVAAALLLVGCGGHSVSSPPVVSRPATRTAPFVCHPKRPAQAGECIRQELEAEGNAPARPLVSGTFGASFPVPQCIDISRWQGVPSFTRLRADGVKCVIVQGADGTSESNPYIGAQVAGARAAGLPYGFYIFAEAEGSNGQADAIGNAAQGRGGTLGVWVDNEVPGSYSHACPIAERLRSRWGYRIVGDYGSPGNVPASLDYCGLYSWPASWGGGRARALPGFPASSLKFRQWCGTCALNGVSGQVDRDEDLGLLALAHGTPRPTHAQQVARWKRELDVAYRLRRELHRDIDRHHCRLTRPTLGHAKPPSYHTVCAQWLAHGQVEVRRVEAFHAKGVL
jgi:hypothetical protein